jgi:hypothetical protein
MRQKDNGYHICTNNNNSLTINIGPYDEIMFVPGNFTIPNNNTAPKIPQKALRIARIYVSQRTTTYNGRVNWNIPKHLARFAFSAPPTPQGQKPPQTLTVNVFAPGTQDGDGTAPFFACTLKPWQWVPALPVNTKYVPLSLTVAQPPIPEPAGYKEALKATIEGPPVDEYDVDPEKALAVLAGTDRWRLFDIAARSPRVRGCWVELHKQNGERRGDQDKVYFPEGLGVWQVGAWFEDIEWTIGDVTEWKL